MSRVGIHLIQVNGALGRRRRGACAVVVDDEFEAEDVVARGRSGPRREAGGGRTPESSGHIGPDVVELGRRYSVPTCAEPAARSAVDSRSNLPDDPTSPARAEA